MMRGSNPKVLRRFVYVTLRGLTALLVALAAGCGVFQRAVLYYPTHDSAAAMERAARSSGFERWKNSDEESIGWRRLSPSQPAGGELLITHGNGGAAVGRVEYGMPLRESMHLDIYILEYPGFGDRPGKPSEDSLFAAAEDAFQSMPKTSRVYLLGESLGTGVATHLAGCHPTEIAGLLLFAPYNNLDDVAQHHVRILPARWLMRDHYRSEEFLSKYQGPVAIVVGGKDQVIPKEYGQRLFDSYKGPKRLWEFTGAGHNSLQPAPPQFWKEVETFWKAGRP